MDGPARPTIEVEPAPVPPGSRLESAWLALLLVADLASIPFHFVLFLARRGRERRAFLHALRNDAP